MKLSLHITQHKRFVPNGTHPNQVLLRLGPEIACANVDASQELFNRVAEMIKKRWASFMLELLGETVALSKRNTFGKLR